MHSFQTIPYFSRIMQGSYDAIWVLLHCPIQRWCDPSNTNHLLLLCKLNRDKRLLLTWSIVFVTFIQVIKLVVTFQVILCSNEHLFQFYVICENPMLRCHWFAILPHSGWSGVAIHHSTDDRLFSILTTIPSPLSRSLHMSHIVYIYTTIYCSYTSLFDLLWVLYLMIFLLFGSMSTRSIFPPIRSPSPGKRQYALSSRMPCCCRCSHFSHNVGHFWVILGAFNILL